MELKIYTDGACSGNPGAGGWGVVMIACKSHAAAKRKETDYCGTDKKNILAYKELSGFAPDTTNNRMELTAVIQGLTAVKQTVPTAVITDSKYVADAFNKNWISGWVKNGWKTSQKKPVANRDLWEQLLELAVKYRPKFVWVKGHADNEYNNRCDELAVTAIKRHG